MDRCQYCGYAKGGHDTNCPHPSATLDRPRVTTPQLEEWERGYRAGRGGQQLTPTAGPVFRMGWTRGDAALDEAGNSYQMWGAPE